MKLKVPFDDHVKEKLDQYSPDVPGHLWENIRNKKDKKRPFFFFLSTSGFLVLSILFAGMTAALLLGRYNSTPTRIVIPASKANALSDKEMLTSEKRAGNQRGETIVSENASSFEKDKFTATAVSTQPVSAIAIRKQPAVAIADPRLQDVNGSDISSPGSPSVQGNSHNRHVITGNISSITDLKESPNELIAIETNSEVIEKENERMLASPQLAELLRLPAPAVSQLKTMAVKNLTIPCPVNTGVSNKKTYVELYGSADYVLRQFSDTPNSTYMKMRKESTSFASAYSAGIRFIRMSDNGCNYSAGLNFSQINEKFKYVEGNIIQVIFIINASGDTIGSYQTSNTRYKTSYNHYKTLDIPVTVGYEFAKGKWSTNFSAGLMFNIHSWNRGEVLNESLQPVDIGGETKNPYQFKTNIGIGGIGSVSLQYQLNNRIGIMGEPYFRYNFSSMNKSDITLKQKYHTSGIRLGVRIDLKSGNKN